MEHVIYPWTYHGCDTFRHTNLVEKSVHKLGYHIYHEHRGIRSIEVTASALISLDNAVEVLHVYSTHSRMGNHQFVRRQHTPQGEKRRNEQTVVVQLCGIGGN